jgi:hypothetical protein
MQRSSRAQGAIVSAAAGLMQGTLSHQVESVEYKLFNPATADTSAITLKGLLSNTQAVRPAAKRRPAAPPLSHANTRHSCTAVKMLLSTRRAAGVPVDPAALTCSTAACTVWHALLLLLALSWMYSLSLAASR